MDVTCLKCKKSFKHILKHLANIPSCRNHYSQDSYDDLTKQCKQIARDQKNLKRRQKYDPQTESARQKMKYDAAVAKYSERNRAQYQQQLSSKKESMKTFNQKMFKDFFQEIQYGPIFPCVCCMKCFTFRGVRILNPNYLEKLQNVRLNYY